MFAFEYQFSKEDTLNAVVLVEVQTSFGFNLYLIVDNFVMVAKSCRTLSIL